MLIIVEIGMSQDSAAALSGDDLEATKIDSPHHSYFVVVM